MRRCTPVISQGCAADYNQDTQHLGYRQLRRQALAPGRNCQVLLSQEAPGRVRGGGGGELRRRGSCAAARTTNVAMGPTRASASAQLSNDDYIITSRWRQGELPLVTLGRPSPGRPGTMEAIWQLDLQRGMHTHGRWAVLAFPASACVAGGSRFLALVAGWWCFPHRVAFVEERVPGK